MVSTLNWILTAQADIAEAVNSAVESAPAGVTEAVANATSTSVSLNWLDWAVIIGYFAIIAGVAIWSSRGQNTSSDFFLGGRNIGWFAIGGSLFASNVGSEHIVGLAGSGANTGLSLAHWELHAWVLLMLGWVFVPYYYRSKVFTMPEFLEKRFSPTARWILSIISLAAYVLTKVSVTVYAGALVFNVLFPDFHLGSLDAFWCGALLTIILTGLYSVFGGLRAVLYTDACQAIILLLGSIFILYFGLSKLEGGWSGLRDFTATNASQYALWHPLSDKDFPWLAICIASPIIGIWYWCTDQYIVQRTLAAKNLTIARRGTIWGAALKVMPVMIFLIPGLIGAALHRQGVIQLPPKFVDGVAVIGSIDGDRVFPTLVTQLLPPGLRGLVIAGLLAALMSSLSSLFNSSAALFTVDIYQKLKKAATEKELVYVGKIATTAVVVCGLIWIPIMKHVAQGGGGLYDYLQNVQSFLAPAITATFLLGIFWSRINAKGAVWGLTVGFILGMGKLTIQTFFSATDPKKIADPAILAKIGDFNAYYACGVLFLATAIVLIVVSLATKAQDLEQIKGLTFSSINKEEVRASIHPVDIVTTLLVVAAILTIYLYFSFWTVGHEPAAVQAAQDLADQAGQFLQ
jgi:SSS family solute:Na+ symporter